MNNKLEPLLNAEENRLVIFPIRYPKLWNMYKIMRSAFWIPDEIDFSRDIDDWNKLTDGERYFVENILAFFAGSDGIVSTNINLNFSEEVKILEAKFVYDFQCMMEDIHAETYSIMIDNYIKDTEKKNRLFNGIENIPCIKKKADWSMKWINSVDEPFAKRLIAFAIVEGIFFSGSFCAIYWLKQRNLLSGLTISNELISRDEGMHCDFACMLYSMIVNKIDEETVHAMFVEALNIEKEFIVESLPCKLIGMNSDLMCQYLEFVADRLLLQLGYSKIYKASNPFAFMDAIGLQGKTNFFEHRVSQYQKAKINVSKPVSSPNKTIELSNDF
jgi:ribonucleoside-diphosphate reductase beta chain